MRSSPTKKQRLFFKAYVGHWNGTRAAIAAGYSPRSARNQACRLLKMPIIKDALARFRKAGDRRLKEYNRKYMQALTAMAFASLADFCDWSGDRIRITDPEKFCELQSLGMVRLTYGGNGIKMCSRKKILALLHFLKLFNALDQGKRPSRVPNEISKVLHARFGDVKPPKVSLKTAA